MQLDKPMNLYNHPSNRFVGSFIGTPAMNFISGNISGMENHFVTTAGTNLLTFSEPVAHTLENYKERVLSLGIRAENVIITPVENQSDCNLTVTAFENMGNEQIIYLAFEDGTLVARRQSSEELNIGSQVGVRLLKDKIIFMDEESGQVLGQ